MSGPAKTYDFLSGGGDMGARMRAHDWENSSLGPPEKWPQSLRVTIRLMLNTRHPMFVWWGPDLIQFYNDAYSETMGPERHPSALGQRGRECWAEIWDIIGPQIDYVMRGEGSTWDEDRLVPVTRHGKREDVWWTYSFSPIDVEGGVGGVLVVCNDVTRQHLANEALKNRTHHLTQIFEQAPGIMAVLRGPDNVFEVTNAAYRQLLGGRDLIGRSVRDAVPEAADQGFIALLGDVYRSGKAHVGTRVPLTLDTADAPREVILDFVYAPIHEPDGTVSGIFVEGIDVTSQVHNEARLRLINLELRHRVKNTLAVVSAIASQTLRGAGADEAVRAYQQRLAAYAGAHDILTAAESAAGYVRDVVEAALVHHEMRAGRIAVEGPAMLIGPKQVLSLALAIHELATNAVKYGALSNEAGRVQIAWEEAGEAGARVLRLSWRESGGPPVSPPSKKGFGSRLIDQVLSSDFGGAVEVDFAPSGLTLTLTAPMANLRGTEEDTFAVF